MIPSMATRRNFLKTAGIVAATLPFLSEELLASSKKVKKTGLALYTIRDAMGNDPVEALASVAALGYNWVEAAGYGDRMFYGMTPKKFGSLVTKSGLKLISSHSAISSENEDIMIADAAEAGLDYLILPSLPHQWYGSVDGFKRAAEYFNRAGEKCKKNGIRFGFHNHQAEFIEIDGKVLFDILLDETDRDNVIFELDLAWIKAAGKDPVKYFEKYPGRFPLWHFKDLNTGKEDATIGEGTIDFKPIYAADKTAGLKYWFIEQDNCSTHTPAESIAISRKYLLDKVL